MTDQRSKVEQYRDSQGSRQRLFQFYREVYPDSPWLLDDDRFRWENLSPPLPTRKTCCHPSDDSQ